MTEEAKAVTDAALTKPASLFCGELARLGRAGLPPQIAVRAAALAVAVALNKGLNDDAVVAAEVIADFVLAGQQMPMAEPAEPAEEERGTARRRWTADEVDLLLAERGKAMSWRQISEKLRRDPMACRTKFLLITGGGETQRRCATCNEPFIVTRANQTTCPAHSTEAEAQAGEADRRRFKHHREPGRPWVMEADDPAAVQGRTRYQKTVRDPNGDTRVLKSAVHNRKIGGAVTKGEWAGMPVYTLTLEERATCNRECPTWLSCYGNKMHLSHRFRHGPELEARLETELAELQALHPGGFAVRLHVLGDFYSPAYVEWWRAWLDQFPALRCYGYTGWPEQSPIGEAVHALRSEQWGRFAIRFSNGDRDLGAITKIKRIGDPDVPDAVVCPAQTEATASCATCALCWATRKTIVFLEH